MNSFDLIRNHGHTRLLVIGDLMVDHYLWGTCDRISPEAPVPVVDIVREDVTLGGAGNVLKNLKAYGANADIVSVIGHDYAGQEIMQLLSEMSFEMQGIFKESQRQTSKKSRVLASGHQMLRIDKETKTAVLRQTEDAITLHLTKVIPEYDLVLVSDYNKGLLTDKLLKVIIQLCNANGKPVIIDPKGSDYSKYSGATIIKPNRKEAAIAVGRELKTIEDVAYAASKLKQELGAEAVVITLSEEGMAIFDGRFTVIPTRASDVFDVTGAGDTVLASLGICIAAGATLHDACTFSNHAAAIVVSKVGSVTTTIDEVYKHYQKSTEHEGINL